MMNAFREDVRHESTREGFALAATLLALIVIGAIVTGGFYVASQESRVSSGHERAGRALYVAEQGMNRVLGSYGRKDYEDAPYDAFYEIESDTIEAGSRSIGTYTVDVRRLDDQMYMVRSQGLLVGGGPTRADRRVARIVRVLELDFPADRAIQIHGGLTVAGNAEIDGEDQHPAHWDDCQATGLHPSIVARDSTLIERTGTAHEITGPIVEDAGMHDEEFTDFGAMDYWELAAMAEKVYTAGETLSDIDPVLTGDGECDFAAPYNWGAPLSDTHACHEYFPIVHVEGTSETPTTISSHGSGQGILLVDGDLSLKGGFEFFGVVIVQGAMTTSGTGAHLNGTVMVRNGGELDTNQTTGNSIVNLSSCAIKRAVEYNSRISRAVPIAERSWIDLSSATAGG